MRYSMVIDLHRMQWIGITSARVNLSHSTLQHERFITRVHIPHECFISYGRITRTNASIFPSERKHKTTKLTNQLTNQPTTKQLNKHTRQGLKRSQRAGHFFRGVTPNAPATRSHPHLFDRTVFRLIVSHLSLSIGRDVKNRNPS